MNEPIMRRGLSLEGRKIRQKHQSSLLNEEFGVTSQPIHMKIERPFMKENVMNLKKIQTKCKSFHKRPPLSNTLPIKALRSTTPVILPEDTKQNVQNTFDANNREGSAHSDYFSMPDETDIETKTKLNKHYPKEAWDGDEHDSLQETSGNNQGESRALLTSPVNKNLSDVFHQSSKPESHNVKLQEKPGEITASTNPNFLSSSFALRKNKLGNIMEKIKKQKPACDINCAILWRDIEKQHKAFFSKQVSNYIPSTDTHTNKTPHLKDTNSIPINEKRPQSRHLQRGHTKVKPFLQVGPESDDAKSAISFHRNTKPDEFSLQGDFGPPKNKEHVSPRIPIKGNLDSSLPQSCSLPDLSDEETNRARYSQCSPVESNPHYLSTRLPQQASTSPPSPLFSTSSTNEKILSQVEDISIHSKGRPPTANSSLKQNATEYINETRSLSGVGSNETNQSKPSVNSQNHKIAKLNLLSRLSQPKTNLVRSKSSGNLHAIGGLPSSYKRGQIPKYLRIRKAEADNRLKAAAAIDPLCPPGHSPLPDYERRNTLHLLKKGQVDVMQQLSSLPLAQDTLRVRAQKKELETKLTQIEEGIEIFSQPKVYVLDE